MRRSSHLASSTRFLLPPLGVAAALLAASPASAMGIRWNLPPAPSAFPGVNLSRSFTSPEFSTPSSFTIHDLTTYDDVPRSGAALLASASAWIGGGWLGADVYASGDVVLGRRVASNGTRIDFQIWGRGDYGPCGARGVLRTVFDGMVISDEHVSDPASVAKDETYWGAAPYASSLDLGPSELRLHLAVTGDVHFDGEAGFSVGMYGAWVYAGATLTGYVRTEATLRREYDWGSDELEFFPASLTVIEDSLHGDANLALENTGPGTWHACASYNLRNDLIKVLDGVLIGGPIEREFVSAPYINPSIGDAADSDRRCTSDISMF